MSKLPLNHLNPQQQEAVQTTDGAQLILAGAGSGKTMTLVYKVAYLIVEKSVPAENILMVTFTNKAATEMKDRIKMLLSKNFDFRISNFELPYAGTFHSLCARILRGHGSVIDIPPSFVIYDESDQKDLFKQIMENLGLSPKKTPPYTLRAIISQAKNELIGADEYPQYARGFMQEAASVVYTPYQKMLQQNSALDFDDLIMETVRLFRQHPDVLTNYHRSFRYIVVDEYQDTNHAQYILTKLLAKGSGNICVVGDASQSIYSWRGANFRNMLDFQKDYPDTKVFHLEQNYRSTQTILDAAFDVIGKNNSHPVLKLWTDAGQGEKVKLFEARNEQDEAFFIVQMVQRLGIDWSDVAILYRTNAQSRVIEEVLLHEGIPYRIYGGVSFYDRKEIKDIIAHLRLVLNLNDSVAAKRIEKLGKRKRDMFVTWLKTLSVDEKTKVSTSELLDMVLEKSQYLSRFDEEIEEDRERLENIKELRSVAAQFPTLSSFLENAALVESETRSKHTSASLSTKQHLNLMTLHAAKGLEFDTVFITGLEEGLFPHSRSLMKNDEMEEERRLCYVGITRAKRNLYLSYARRRFYFGIHSSNMVSRFIADIATELTEQNLSLL